MDIDKYCPIQSLLMIR